MHLRDRKRLRRARCVPVSQASSSLCPESSWRTRLRRAGHRCGRRRRLRLVQMGVHAPGYRPRRIYDRHCHPFSLICKGVARAAPGVRRRCDRPLRAGRSAAPKVRLVPLENLALVDTLLHRQAEPSANLKSGQGPVEPDGSTLHPGGGGSPGIKLYVNTPCRVCICQKEPLPGETSAHIYYV